MKPSDFFLGVMEFFSILVPGTLATFLLLPASPHVFGSVLPALPGQAAEWTAFLVCAYVAGHLLHHVGSFLDTFYDDVYVPMARSESDIALLEAARALMRSDLVDLVTGERLSMLSTFTWASAWVKTRSPMAASEIERSGAESKFFRSLCLIGVLGVVVFAYREVPPAAGASALLAVFSLVRFCKRRLDTSTQIYEYFVMLKKFPTVQPSVAIAQA